MIKLALTEAVDFLDNEFLTKSELPIDLQWKIYRGTLSRQSLPLKIYSEFQKQYDSFYEIHDKVFSEDPEVDFSVLTDIDMLGNSLEKLYDEVSGYLNKEARFELKTCLEKLVNYLKDLREKVSTDYYA